MDFKEKVISTNEIYNGRIIKLHVKEVECPNGRIAKRELVLHPGGVGIVPVDEKGNVYMVRQYRIPYDSNMLEIPAGKLDLKEEADNAAVRELKEETGITANEIIFMGNFYPSVGFLNENLRLYVALGLSFGETDPDEDEFCDVVKIHINKLVDMIMNNEIKDGKTIAAIFMAREYLKNNKKEIL